MTQPQPAPTPPLSLPAPAGGLPRVPASFFGMVLGFGGLGGAWREAHRLWSLPAAVGEALLAAAALIWAVLLFLYVAKWISARREAQSELDHPIQCCFVGLIGVATMLVALGALPYSRPLGIGLLTLGALFTAAFGIWRTGLLWRGGREHATTTPVMYLPTVAGSFVTATGLGALGLQDWGQMAFGAGFFSWLAIESVLMVRLYTAAPMEPMLRPSLGIQLAPPTVGLIAYLAVNPGPPDLIAHALLGYGVLQGLLLLRMIPWIAEHPFTPSYWGFTFGLTALATAPLRMIERGDTGAAATLAPALFVIANAAIALIALLTVRLLAQGRLFPKPAAAR
ncbi:dicarboxylate transporter/tellurite-resistance protein TehA [Azorhizobium doebereinerae]|uniref:dicarboxylate transporter/tellurite-resistance protein TehA n=1 Tax=Azorhizobium doebereinerae TaxID=281091 RepID=UPI0004141FF1|nr:dicarboxylate transporter/tellurite-resistance protein TehA [Azorhizobium doebereinerae]